MQGAVFCLSREKGDALEKWWGCPAMIQSLVLWLTPYTILEFGAYHEGRISMLLRTACCSSSWMPRSMRIYWLFITHVSPQTNNFVMSINRLYSMCDKLCTATAHRHPTFCAWTFSRSMIECTATNHVIFSCHIYTSFHGNLFPLAWIWVVTPHNLTWASLDTSDWGDSL